MGPPGFELSQRLARQSELSRYHTACRSDEKEDSERCEDDEEEEDEGERGETEAIGGDDEDEEEEESEEPARTFVFSGICWPASEVIWSFPIESRLMVRLE